LTMRRSFLSVVSSRSLAAERVVWLGIDGTRVPHPHGCRYPLEIKTLTALLRFNAGGAHRHGAERQAAAGNARPWSDQRNPM
jgi:hypothetical protein